MKKISCLIAAICIWAASFGQVPPVNDTLIPKQHKDDTVTYEPKLKGGALIDTINSTDDKKFYQRQEAPDSGQMKKNPAGKPK